MRMFVCEFYSGQVAQSQMSPIYNQPHVSTAMQIGRPRVAPKRVDRPLSCLVEVTHVRCARRQCVDEQRVEQPGVSFDATSAVGQSGYLFPDQVVVRHDHAGALANLNDATRHATSMRLPAPPWNSGLVLTLTITRPTAMLDNPTSTPERPS